MNSACKRWYSLNSNYTMVKLVGLASVVIAVTLSAACRGRQQSVSFYYWKTAFKLNGYEKRVLESNGVKTLYLRYFDVDFTPGSFEPEPVSPVSIDGPTEPYQIVPVVYLKNRVFERVDSAGVLEMASNIFSFVSQISNTHAIGSAEIQFDCDWTESTQRKYFFFIQQYRRISKQRVSATIRLHQVKYHQRTGIPPVDFGVLMYYNMGSVSAANINSIYDRSIAERYASYLHSYPMELDIALPIFLWGIQTRQGKVVQLLNKMNFSHFENDSNFIPVEKNSFSVKHASFKGGYYFRKNDLIKLENVPTESLREIAEQVNRHSNHQIRNLIFYDLDSLNLIHYDKNVFKEILHLID